MSSDEKSRALTGLSKQAAELIDEDTTAIELVSRLDVSRYSYRDSSADWADSTAFEPMFKAVILQALEEYSDQELCNQLGDEDVASALGFERGEVPSRSTFTRARLNRFEEAMSTIERSAEQIRGIAVECGSPIGSELVPDESEKTSERSERREIRRLTTEVIDEMENVVFPVWDLPQPDEAIYDEDDLLLVETLAGVLDDVGLNEAANIHGDFADPGAELGEDHPFYVDGPTGETVLSALKQLSPTDISEMINRAARKCFMRVKPYEEFKTPVTLAIDITYVAYYGERDEMIRVQGVPRNRDKDYDWCHKFATANIVGENTHFVLAMLPVGDPDHHDAAAYPGEDKTHRPGAVIRDLLDIVDDVMSIRVVYADREFCAADSFAALEERDLLYVIPSPDYGRVDRDVDQVVVKENHAVYGPVKGGVTNQRVETTLAVLPPDEDYDKTQVFATNLSVDDEIGLDRRRTRKKIERYEKRAGIETAYSKIKQFGGMTTSRSYPVRLFHFGMGVLLYNMWLLVDFLVQVSMEGEFRPKPRVTAERFRKFVERLLDELRPG